MEVGPGRTECSGKAMNNFFEVLDWPVRVCLFK
jgi:hypothetical protein